MNGLGLGRIEDLRNTRLGQAARQFLQAVDFRRMGWIDVLGSSRNGAPILSTSLH